MSIFSERASLEDLIRDTKVSTYKAYGAIGQWDYDPVTNQIRCSKAFRKIFEIESEQEVILFSAILDLMHPDEKDKIKNLFFDTVDQKQPFELTHRLKMKDGSIKYVYISCANLFAEDGAYIRSVGTAKEVTSQIEVEEELKVNQKNLFSLVNQLFEQLMVVNLDYEIIDVNLSFETEYKQTREELIGQKCYAVTHNRTEPCTGLDHVCPLQVVLHNKTAHTARHIHTNPHIGERIVDIHGIPLLDSDGEVTSMVEVINDITDYVVAERNAFTDAERASSLTRIANRFNTYLEMEAIAEAICEELAQALKAPYVILRLNDLETNEFVYAGQFGFSLTEKPLMHDLCSFLEYHAQISDQLEMVPNIREIAEKENIQLIEGSDIQSGMVSIIQRNNVLIGMVYIFLTEEEQVIDGHALKFVQGLINQAAIALENARLYQAERNSWKTSEALRRISLDLTSTMAIDQVLERMLIELQRVVPYDKATIQLLENDRFKIVSEKGFEDSANLVGAKFPMSGNEWYNEVVISKKPSTHIYQNRGKDALVGGDVSSFESWLGAPLLIGDELIGLITLTKAYPGFYSEKHEVTVMSFAASSAIAVQNARLFDDLHEQMRILKETQDLLVQTEKLSALGKLITGIAHELNNPLATILLLAQQSLEENDFQAITEDLKRIAGEAKRTSRIVRDLQIFARHQKPDRQLVNVNDFIKMVASNFSYKFSKQGIVVDYVLSQNLPEIYIDKEQIQQVLINILENAIYAMGNSAGVRSLKIVTQTGDSIYMPSSKASKMVRIKVEDTGPGILPEVLPHIFEPFFSTKKIGEGTGFGLPISHGIVTEHGGNIWAESQVGRGTAMIVELPVFSDMPGVSTQDEIEKSAAPQKIQKIGPNSPSVLIIDDEQKLLDILSRILSKRGFQVTTANNGRQGASLAIATKPNLVVCDLLMPEMDGRDVYYSLKENAPELIEKMMFITGDSVSKESASFLSESNVPALNKPFELDVFVDFVQMQIYNGKGN